MEGNGCDSAVAVFSYTPIGLVYPVVNKLRKSMMAALAGEI
jgi:hypothetical protein